MAASGLTANQSTDFFRQRILLNAKYWQEYVSDKAADITALEGSRELIVRAITFALDLTEAWQLVYDLMVAFSPFMERRGHWEIWEQALKRAIVVAQLKGDTTHQITLMVLLARLSFQQSRFKESVSYYRQTLRLARQARDKFNEGRVCTNLGFYYTEQGQWHRAEVLCCHALRLFEYLDNDHGRAHTENHLGFLYTRRHCWEQAQQHLERACAIWQAMGDNHGLMRGLLNLGLLYVDVGQPDLALEYLEKALHQAQVTGENIVTGRIYINIGKAYRLTENWAEAEASTKQAETIFRQYSNLAELARTWNGLGLIYFYQDRVEQGIFYLEKALELWRNLGVEFEEVETLLDMGECELKRGNKTVAVAHLQSVEHFMGSTLRQGLYRHLQPRLTQYRQLLESGQSATWNRSL